jgi:hypothetical protein
MLLAAAMFLGCSGGVPRGGIEPRAGSAVRPEIRGRVERLEMDLSVLQNQVSTQVSIYDLSQSQLRDRELQYQKQTSLWKGMVFFLMGLSVVMFFAPAPETRWTTVLMVSSLVATLGLIGVWMFQV